MKSKKSKKSARKMPDLEKVLQKRQELASAIKENIKEQKPKAKRKQPLLAREVGRLDRSHEYLPTEELVEKVAVEPTVSVLKGKEVNVRVVTSPSVSPHVVDIKQMLAEKEVVRLAAEEKKQRSIVVQLTDKKKLFNTLDEISLISLGKGIYLGCRKGISSLFASSLKVSPARIVQKRKEPLSIRFNNLLRPSFAFALPAGWQKSIIAFVLVCLVLVLPIQALTYYSKLQDKKAAVMGLSAEGLVHLKSGVVAASEYSFSSAEEEFALASKSFSDAYSQLEHIDDTAYRILSHLPLAGKKVKSGETLLNIGKNFSLLGQLFSQGAQSLEFSLSAGDSLTDRLNTISVNTQKIDEVLAVIEEDMKNVDLSLLPDAQQKEFLMLKEKLPAIKSINQRLNNLSSMFYEVMAPDGMKRYLLIFKNNREMRATGGFMGSYAIVDIYKGKVETFEVPAGGTYDVSGQLRAEIVPPEAMQRITRKWEFHDSNWWPDWPTSARKVIWFFEQGAGTSVDGVITLTAGVVEDLLPIYGPIDLDDYEQIITRDNFIDLVQEEIEDEREVESIKPKQILTDMSAVLLERLLNSNKDELLASFEVLSQAARSKDILFYFPDQDMQRMTLNNNLGGEIKQPEGDYLQVVNTNIGGGKTDHVIDENVWHDIEILDDGSVIDTLTIEREHTGDPYSFFDSHINFNYLRVYVPLGSELLEAGGFSPPPINEFLAPSAEAVIDKDLQRIEGTYIVEPYTKTKIYEQFGKTVYANWTKNVAGQTTKIKIKYKLPFRIDSPKDKGWASWIVEKLSREDDINVYSLTLQKQPGTQAKDYFLTISYPPQAVVKSNYYPAECQTEPGFIDCDMELASDKMFALALGQQKD